MIQLLKENKIYLNFKSIRIIIFYKKIKKNFVNYLKTNVILKIIIKNNCKINKNLKRWTFGEFETSKFPIIE